MALASAAFTSLPAQAVQQLESNLVKSTVTIATANEGSTEWGGNELKSWMKNISNRCEIVLRAFGVDVNTNMTLGMTTERVAPQTSDSNGKEVGKH
jgi:hypothetical protein